jgi:hypothetical protein
MVSRRELLGLATALAIRSGEAQVIEFESGGLRYQTQTKNGVTVMFAHMPLLVREYAVVQVAVSNGSSTFWNIKPEDFQFERADGTKVRAANARAVVGGFIERGGRDDVVKLVSAYEMGLYGMNRTKTTNGYESRRQAAMAEMTSARLKAAAAASAIVFTPVRLKPGESTDGAVFYPNAGKPLGTGKLKVETAGEVFEFIANEPASAVRKTTP